MSGTHGDDNTYRVLTDDELQAIIQEIREVDLQNFGEMLASHIEYGAAYPALEHRIGIAWCGCDDEVYVDLDRYGAFTLTAPARLRVYLDDCAWIKDCGPVGKSSPWRRYVLRHGRVDGSIRGVLFHPSLPRDGKGRNKWGVVEEYVQALIGQSGGSRRWPGSQEHEDILREALLEWEETSDKAWVT